MEGRVESFMEVGTREEQRVGSARLNRGGEAGQRP